MTTHRSIVDALSRAAASNESVVLATVVRITGSSYGGVGARMVAHVDGSTVGLVSGGCLETDLAERARQVHATGRAEVVTYDTRADDDAAWGLGLGCNGLIDVLLEPLSPDRAAELATLLKRALAAESLAVLATVIESTAVTKSGSMVGAHALFTDDSVETTGDWEDNSVLDAIALNVNDALSAGRRGLTQTYDAMEVAFEVITPSVHFVICGSGPDVVPLVRFAFELGWDVTVVDHRPVAHANPERFPGARVVECANALQLAESVALMPRTCAVVMSHHFGRDTDYVQALLGAGIGYVGVLGPRARTERMLSELGSASGTRVAPSSSLFGPVGLDIGGDGPDAIALSIIAEVSAVAHGRRGEHLRDRDAPLHESPSRAAVTERG